MIGLENCEGYINEPRRSFEEKRVRYDAASDLLVDMGLSDVDTVLDIGAGWTEMDYVLRTHVNFMGRYIPVDGGIDGVNVDAWDWMPRQTDYLVALEIVEHLTAPEVFLHKILKSATKGIVLSTPNPQRVDVLAMDPDHKSSIWGADLQNYGFSVQYQNFYGSNYDGILAWYAPEVD